MYLEKFITLIKYEVFKFYNLNESKWFYITFVQMKRLMGVHMVYEMARAAVAMAAASLKPAHSRVTPFSSFPQSSDL